MKKTLLSVRLIQVMISVIAFGVLLLPAQVLSHGNDNIQERAAELIGLTEERIADASAAINQKREQEQAVASSAEARIEACESTEPQLANLMDEQSEQALSDAYAYDAILLEIKDYTAESGIVELLIDDFAHEATNAQAVAQVEAGALALLNTNIDCSDPDVAVAIGAFRATTEATKSALEEYRQQLLELIGTVATASDTAQHEVNALAAISSRFDGLETGDLR